jgi:hypothetical protein
MYLSHIFRAQKKIDANSISYIGQRETPVKGSSAHLRIIATMLRFAILHTDPPIRYSGIETEHFVSRKGHHRGTGSNEKALQIGKALNIWRARQDLNPRPPGS